MLNKDDHMGSYLTIKTKINKKNYFKMEKNCCFKSKFNI